MLTDLKDRSHVGENWNRYFLRSMQIILQATHGVVSGAPQYFRRAFGDNVDEFEALLLRPEKYLFNRVWYEELDGAAEFEQYLSESRSLSVTDRHELASLLSSTGPSKFRELQNKTGNLSVRKLLPYYFPLDDDSERRIWNASKAHRETISDSAVIPEDELVEDAGLAEAA